MSRRAVLTGWTIVVLTTVFVVLFLWGIAEPGLRVGIRATARLSAIAIAFAFAGIRVREALTGLVISHAAHFAMIGAVAVTTSPANAHINMISIPGGAALYGLMIFAALTQRRWAIYILWIAFVIGLGGRMHQSIIYPFMTALLVAAAVVRFAPRRVESPNPTQG